MTPRSIDLTGCTQAEAKAKISAFVAEVQEEAVEDLEVAMVDAGADRDDIAAELTRRRSELAVLHEETLSRLRPWLERDGKTLQ